MEASRTKKAIKNSVVGVTAYILNALTVFFAQRIFKDTLGVDMLGLNYVFLTILGALALAELGVGTAIVFSLYAPIARGDETKIASLIQLYRKLYAVIGGIVLALGLILIPALPAITKGAYTLATLVPYYLLFLVNTSLSYLFTYNQTLLNACQRNYVVSSVNAATKIVITLVQIGMLFAFKSYLAYLIVMVVFNLVSSIGLMLYVQKKYPYITRKAPKVSPLERKGIWKNVGALMYHRVGDYLLDGIDNIVISVILGTVLVGYYSFYATLTNTLFLVMCNLFAGLTAGLGNLYVTESRQHVQRVFKRLNFIGFVISGIFTAGLFVLANQFIVLWMGNADGLQSFLFVFFWALNFFLRAYSEPMQNLRAAAGKYTPDKYLNIVIALLNLGLSVGLVFLIGLPGVVIGTTICLIIKRVIVVPFIAKKYIYGGKFRTYYVRFLYDFLCLAIAATASYFACIALPIDNSVLKFVTGGLLTVAMTAATMSLMNFRRPEFAYVAGLVGRLFKRKRKSDKVTAETELTEKTAAVEPAVKVLVTGAESIVGRELLKKLSEQSIEAFAADEHSYCAEDLTETRDYVARLSPTVVVDCTSGTPLSADALVMRARQLATVCGDMDIKVIYLSDANVYRGRGSKPILPTEKLNPVSQHGLTILKCEEEHLMYVRKLFIVRAGTVFGADGEGILENGGDGDSEKRSDSIISPTYAPDLADFLVYMMATGKYGVYHCANLGSCTYDAFAAEYRRLNGAEIEAVGTMTLNKPRSFALDVACLTDAGYDGMPTWNDALARFVRESHKKEITE